MVRGVSLAFLGRGRWSVLVAPTRSGEESHEHDRSRDIIIRHAVPSMGGLIGELMGELMGELICGMIR